MKLGTVGKKCMRESRKEFLAQCQLNKVVFVHNTLVLK